MKSNISERARAYLAAWHSRRPALAMMGEYSSGKSALLNSLLGRPLLPTRVTATDLPIVWVTNGSGGAIQGLTFDGHLVDLAIEDLTNGQAMQFLCIRIETEAEILNRIDIIDTPGISDPRMTTEIVEETAQHVDFVIWCSPLNQAWRQTERAFWKSLPNTLKADSILALTRADLMINPKDMAKVVARCAAETAGSFSAIQPVAAPLAIVAQSAETESERRRLRQASGISALLETISRSVTSAEESCAARPKIDSPKSLEVLSLTNEMSEELEASAPTKKAASKTQLSTKSQSKARSRVLALLEVVRNCAPNEQVFDTVGLQISQLLKEKAFAIEHRDVLIRALTASGVGGLRTDRMLKQVRHEVEDFADGPWCDLSQ